MRPDPNDISYWHDQALYVEARVAELEAALESVRRGVESFWTWHNDPTTHPGSPDPTGGHMTAIRAVAEGALEGGAK